MKRKYLLKTLFALILSLTFFACNEDTTSTQLDETSIDLSNLRISLDGLNFNKPQIVFKYQNIKEAKEKASLFTKLIFDEIDEVIESDKKITNVLYTLKFEKGVAALEDVYVLNAKEKVIINSPNNNTLNRDPLDIDWESVLNGARCPAGWTNNGSCSSSSCVAETTQEILTDSDGGIGSSGDCVEVRYNRGLLSVRICSRSCP